MKDILRTGSITLRPLTPDDMQTRARWTADPELSLLMGCKPAPEPALSSPDEETRSNREWLAQRHKTGTKPYAIEVSGRYIGDIDYGIYPERGMADLTVLIGERAYWGKGYGTQAVELILVKFFSRPPIEFVEADVAPHNDRALRFWKKLNFRDHHTDENGTRFLRRYRET